MADNTYDQVPESLHIKFVIHFILDVIFALPLLLFPEILQPLFGWSTVDPITTRIVGAAFMGMGVES